MKMHKDVNRQVIESEGRRAESVAGSRGQFVSCNQALTNSRPNVPSWYGQALTHQFTISPTH